MLCPTMNWGHQRAQNMHKHTQTRLWRAFVFCLPQNLQHKKSHHSCALLFHIVMAYMMHGKDYSQSAKCEKTVHTRSSPLSVIGCPRWHSTIKDLTKDFPKSRYCYFGKPNWQFWNVIHKQIFNWHANLREMFRCSPLLPDTLSG